MATDWTKATEKECIEALCDIREDKFRIAQQVIPLLIRLGMRTLAAQQFVCSVACAAAETREGGE